MDEPKGSIDRLKTALYSREGLQKHRVRRTMRGWGSGSEDVQHEWEGADEEIVPPAALFPGLQKRSFGGLVLLSSVVFFVICLIVAAFFYFGGGNLISNSNIDIQVSGPVSTPGGQELVLQVAIANRNSVPIKLADFIVEYPPGARSANNLTLDLQRTRDTIGTINPGERVNRTVRAVLFGKENEGQKIKMTLEYRIDGSNAIFYKEETYEVLISSSPLSIVVGGLDEVIDGQETTFTLDVISNSPTAIEDAMIKAEYPFGFNFVSAEPKPDSGNDVWHLGLMKPGEKRRITLHGRVYGQNTEERVFRFIGGVESPKDDRELATTFGTIVLPLKIAKPFVTMKLTVNNVEGTEFVAPAGEAFTANLAWINNLPSQITDAEVHVKIHGNAFNELSVSSSRGFYDSLTDTVRWTREDIPDLALLRPGEAINANFRLVPLDRIGDTFIDKPSLGFDITISGRRLGETGVPEVIESTVVANVKVQTDLKFVSRAVYSVGPFTNTGPMPPRAEQETTYTVIWTLTNGANDVTNGKVSATLPTYMRWVGTKSPDSENIEYNPVSRLITWDVGNISAKAGYQKPPKEVAFQIALVPSLSQVKQSPTILTAATFTGVDRYTTKPLSFMTRLLSTNLTTDAGMSAIPYHQFVVP